MVFIYALAFANAFNRNSIERVNVMANLFQTTRNVIFFCYWYIHWHGVLIFLHITRFGFIHSILRSKVKKNKQEDSTMRNVTFFQIIKFHTLVTYNLFGFMLIFDKCSGKTNKRLEFSTNFTMQLTKEKNGYFPLITSIL